MRNDTSDDTCSVLSDLYARGFSVVRLSAVESAAVSQGFDVVRSVFASSAFSVPYDDLLEFGRLEQPHKSFFAVKRDAGSVLTWPADEQLRARVLELFDALDSAARRVFDQIVRHWGCEETAHSLLDPPRLQCGELSASFMHLFRYEPSSKLDNPESCHPHTDSGFVTIIPTATSEGLEVLNLKSGQWQTAEDKSANPDVECGMTAVVIGGEALAALSCTAGKEFLPASVHRVLMHDKERFSMPFQLRPTRIFL